MPCKWSRNVENKIEDGGWQNIRHLAQFRFAVRPLKSCARFSDEQNLKLN